MTSHLCSTFWTPLWSSGSLIRIFTSSLPPVDRRPSRSFRNKNHSAYCVALISKAVFSSLVHLPQKHCVFPMYSPAAGASHYNGPAAYRFAGTLCQNNKNIYHLFKKQLFLQIMIEAEAKQVNLTPWYKPPASIPFYSWAAWTSSACAGSVTWSSGCIQAHTKSSGHWSYPSGTPPYK